MDIKIARKITSRPDSDVSQIGPRNMKLRASLCHLQKKKKKKLRVEASTQYPLIIRPRNTLYIRNEDNNYISRPYVMIRFFETQTTLNFYFCLESDSKSSREIKSMVLSIRPHRNNIL